MMVAKRLILPLFALAAMASYADVDYSAGALLVCEGQYGADYGSLVFIERDGSYQCNAFSSVNPGRYLGTTSQSACRYGSAVYVVSKERTGGAFVTAMDGTTLQYKGALDELPGRTQAFFMTAVSEHTGYLSSSEGLYEIDLDEMTIRRRVTSPSLSAGMFGQSVVCDGKLFVISRRDGVVVIGAATGEVEKIIPIVGAAAIAVAANGEIFVATTNGNAELVAVSPSDLTTRKINLPGTEAALSDRWESWTLQPFAVDTVKNVLYLADCGDSSVGRYDIATGDFTPDFIKLPPSVSSLSKTLYGQGIGVEPSTGDIALIAAESEGDYFTDIFSVYYADSTTGKIRMERAVNLPEEYLFPTQILFPGDYSAGMVAEEANCAEIVANLYSATGQLIRMNITEKDLENLRSGIYIFGNRKIAVR